MPNNTANKLSFTYFGDDKNKLKEIESFLDSESKELDFEKILPLNGKEPRDVWDTKWNSYSVIKIKPEDYKLVYFFQTAWSYPTPIIELIFSKFPGVYISFTSACEGGWFALSMDRCDSDMDIEKVEFTTDFGNDYNGHVRSAMLAALSM